MPPAPCQAAWHPRWQQQRHAFENYSLNHSLKCEIEWLESHELQLGSDSAYLM
jgi:hypothetical protein